MSKKTLKVLAYDEICRRILSCNFAPGTMLNSNDLILSINRRFRVISGRTIPDRLRNSAEEHIKIIDALLAGDLTLAASMMNAHLSNSREATLILCQKNTNCTES